MIGGWLQACQLSPLIPRATRTFSEKGEISYWCRMRVSASAVISSPNNSARGIPQGAHGRRLMAAFCDAGRFFWGLVLARIRRGVGAVRGPAPLSAAKGV